MRNHLNSPRQRFRGPCVDRLSQACAETVAMVESDDPQPNPGVVQNLAFGGRDATARHSVLSRQIAEHPDTRNQLPPYYYAGNLQ